MVEGDESEVGWPPEEERPPSPELELALASLRAAERMYDGLPYFEPEHFHLPVVNCLADVLLGLGELDEAMALYEKDYLEHPGNGWSLLGAGRVARAREARGEPDGAGKVVGAAAIEAGERSWMRTADFVPPRACMEVPAVVRPAAGASAARRG